MNAVSEAIHATAADTTSNPRFIDNGDDTITDSRTGLMWSQATLSSKCVNHKNAEKVCADLALAGHTDWRLPGVRAVLHFAPVRSGA